MDDHFEWRVIWNWIELYGDAGLLKNRNQSGKFVYGGIRLNLVPDYFEMYLPVYSSNGWEMRQDTTRKNPLYNYIIAQNIN
jgi:hypothetical protein